MVRISRRVGLASLVAILAVATGAVGRPSPAHAQGAPGCGEVITTSTTLSSDIGPCAGNGLTIAASNIVLDCAGHTLTGPGNGIGGGGYYGFTGITLPNGTQGVTLENCNVANFVTGVLVHYASGNTLEGNTVSGTSWGFWITFYSSGNTLVGNTASASSGSGYYLDGVSNNTLTGNRDENGGGFMVDSGSNNLLSGNTAVGSGFALQYATGNTLIGNSASQGPWDGFYAYSASGNTLSGNTSNDNARYGFEDVLSSGNGTAGTADTYLNDICTNNQAGGSSPPGLCLSLPTSADQCKNGGWQAFGLFKSQGDCVSYVASGGRNQPG